MSDKNNSFCLAPWVHTFISPSGNRRLCCISADAPKEPPDFKSYWNSEYLKNIRKKMLNGSAVTDCLTCDGPTQPYRNYFNHEFSDLRTTVLKNTREDGHFSGLPVSLDFRINHLCNFKCQMCGPHYSTSWESEIIRSGERYSLPQWLNQDRHLTERFQKETGPEELMEFIRSGQLQDVYWAGGEPLINPWHWKAMDLLIQTGQSEKVMVRYNTNLSQLKFKELDFSRLLEYFPRFQIRASLDATGEIGEFLRTGLNWSVWLENLEQLLPLANGHSRAIYLEHRLTLPGLFDLVNFVKFANEKKLNILSKPIEAESFENKISLLDPLILPRKLLVPLLERLIAEIQILDQGYAETVLKVLHELKTAPTVAEKYEPHLYYHDLFESLQRQLYKDKKDNVKFGYMNCFQNAPEITEFFNKYR